MRDPEKYRAWYKDWYAKNKERVSAAGKAWYAANPEKAREKGRRYRHGITPEEYREMLSKQHGRCTICGGTDSKRKNAPALCVDHCHNTGKIRGLLCNDCNVGIGRLATSAACQRAADYLEKDSDHDEETRWLAYSAGCSIC